MSKRTRIYPGTYLHEETGIVTKHECPPIGTNRFDWNATFDGYEPGDPIGFGPDEASAIKNLMEAVDD